MQVAVDVFVISSLQLHGSTTTGCHLHKNKTSVRLGCELTATGLTFAVSLGNLTCGSAPSVSHDKQMMASLQPTCLIDSYVIESLWHSNSSHTGDLDSSWYNKTPFTLFHIFI